jgi:hypothetical protein
MVEVAAEVATDFPENWKVTRPYPATQAKGLHYRQAKPLRNRGENECVGPLVTVLQFAVVEVMEEEEALTQLPVRTDPLQDGGTFPACFPYDAKRCLTSSRPGRIEGIQEIDVVLSGLDGAHRKVHPGAPRLPEDSAERRPHLARGFGEVQFGAEPDHTKGRPPRTEFRIERPQFSLCLHRHRSGDANEEVCMTDRLGKPLFERDDEIESTKVGHENGDEIIQHHANSGSLSLRLHDSLPGRNKPTRIQENQDVASLESRTLNFHAVAMCPDQLARSQNGRPEAPLDLTLEQDTSNRCRKTGSKIPGPPQ